MTVDDHNHNQFPNEPTMKHIKTSKPLIAFGILALVALQSGQLEASFQAATQAQEVQTIEKSKLGSAVNVHQCGNLFTAGQFTKDDIAALQKAEIKKIVSLRTDGEIDWDEKAAVEGAEIEFHSIPFKQPETMTDEVFDKVRSLLKDQSSKTLFHCGSASRVGGVWLPYRVLDEGVELETAIAEAKEIGLRSPAMEKKAIDYIKRKQIELQQANSEQSVKPGINKSFLDPELDVDRYLKRFEVESREIYVARENIVAACGIKPGDSVADVGAGTGLFSRLFSKATGNDGWVFAVDISPRFLSHINRESQLNKIENITGVLCAENSVKLPPNSADVVFICDTYHHFEFPSSTMASIKRALKPDGHLILIDFDRIPGTTRQWLLDHVRAGKEVFRAEIQDAGFTLVEEKKIEGLKENYFLKFKKN